MKKKNDALLMYRIANYYYNENLSQNEIAQLENVSRSQISRLLILAREKGLVQISVTLPDMSSVHMLEKKLKERLGIDNVMIAETSAFENTDDTEYDILEDVSTFASAALPELLKESRVIGIGWGRTIYNVSLQLPVSSSEYRKVFVPLVGNSGVRREALQTSTMVSRFVERFRAAGFYLNFSCVQFLGGALSSYEESCIQQLNSYWDKLDSAVFSLGVAPTEGTTYIEELSKENIDLKSLSSSSGEIFGQPYSETGPLQWFLEKAQEYYYIGISLEKLKDVKNTICIASGINKVTPIITAAKLGYMKTLITDNLTAELILKS